MPFGVGERLGFLPFGFVVALASIPEGVEGAKAFFSTVIRRGETVLAEVKSSWCCLDAATLRPSRIAGDLAQLFLR